MKRETTIRLASLALWGILAVAGVRPAFGQNPTDAPAKPAGRGIPSLGDADIENTTEDPLKGWKADNGPLTGLQSPTLGTVQSPHNYWIPGFQYGSTIQNGDAGTGSTGWFSDHYFAANVSLLEQWSGAQFALNYAGGGFVTTQTGQDNGWYQQLAVAQTFEGKRWQVQLLDQFSYLPVSQFGFGGGTGLGLPGVGGTTGPSVPGVGGSVAPNQSIYAAVGPRYTNSWTTQFTYQTSARSSVTVGGSYGLLRFTQSGNVDTDTYIGNVGYNYQLTKEDTIGAFYRFTAYHFQNEPEAIGDHIINVAYGRKITRRLALQLNGGPEISTYRVAIGGQKRTTAGSGGANLTYGFQQGDVTLSYFHGLNSGSGVLIGSNSDQFTVTASRRVTRVWNVHGNFGYAKNRPLTSQTGAQGIGYDSFYAGAGVDRPITREVNFSVAYTAQIQKASATVCTGTGCDNSSTQHVITFNLQWHTRPLVLP